MSKCGKWALQKINKTNYFSKFFLKCLWAGSWLLCPPWTPSLQAFCLIPRLWNSPLSKRTQSISWIWDAEEAATRQATLISFLSTLPTDIPELNRSLYDQPGIYLPQIPWEPGMSDQDTPSAGSNLKLFDAFCYRWSLGLVLSTKIKMCIFPQWLHINTSLDYNSS